MLVLSKYPVNILLLNIYWLFDSNFLKVIIWYFKKFVSNIINMQNLEKQNVVLGFVIWSNY